MKADDHLTQISVCLKEFAFLLRQHKSENAGEIDCGRQNLHPHWFMKRAEIGMDLPPRFSLRFANKLEWL